MNIAKLIQRHWEVYEIIIEMNQIGEHNVNYSIKDSKSFDYKTSITRKLEGNNREKNVEIVLPLNI